MAYAEVALYCGSHACSAAACELQPLLQHLTLLSANIDLFNHIMPWFAQGVDAGDSELRLSNGALNLKWDIAQSRELFTTILDKQN